MTYIIKFDQAADQDVRAQWEDRGQRMAGRQGSELFRAVVKEGTGSDQDRTNTLLRNCEGRFEIAISSGVHNNKLQPELRRRRPKVCDHGLGRRSDRVRENAEHGSIGHQLAEQLQSFWRQLANKTGATGNVRARPVEAGDKTQCDRGRFPSGFGVQALEKPNGEVLVIIGGLVEKEPDHRHRNLLRPSRKRPRRRAPEPCD
jgi:hypothetical protein